MTTPAKPELEFDGICIVRTDGDVIAKLDRHQSAEQINHYGELFASAPALYAALKTAVERLDSIEGGSGAFKALNKRAIEQALAALSLARGGVADGQGVGVDSGRGEKGGE